MTAPVFDAPRKTFAVTPPFAWPSVWDDSYLRTVQPAPFNVPTRYRHNVGTYTQSPLSYQASYYGESGINAQEIALKWLDQDFIAEVQNRAYQRLKGKTYDAAAIGIDIAESRQAFSMISESSLTLLRFARKLRALDFFGAAAELRLKLVPQGVKVRKSFANNFLEFHFGWEPLVKDIYQALEIATDPGEVYTPVKGTATVTKSFNLTFNNGQRHTMVSQIYRGSQGYSAVLIRDSGAFNLERYGLNNPYSVAWELVPWSFVADWFGTVGEVISSYTDFAGLEIRNAYSTTTCQTSVQGFTRQQDGLEPVPGVADLQFSGTGMWVEREVGLTPPVLKLRSFKPFSASRAVTALSLLIQQLK